VRRFADLGLLFVLWHSQLIANIARSKIITNALCLQVRVVLRLVGLLGYSAAVSGQSISGIMPKDATLITNFCGFVDYEYLIPKVRSMLVLCIAQLHYCPVGAMIVLYAEHLLARVFCFCCCHRASMTPH
jgi:hypothetical protein